METRIFFSRRRGVVNLPVEVNPRDSAGERDRPRRTVTNAVRDLDGHGVLSGEGGKLCCREGEGVGLPAHRVLDGANLDAVQALHDLQRVTGVTVSDAILVTRGARDRAEVLVGAADRRVYIVRNRSGRARGVGAVCCLAILARTR